MVQRASGGAAPLNEGRRPFLRSARRVNWLTSNTEPPVSSMERFIGPTSSGKMRKPTTFSAAAARSGSPSSASMPTKASRPPSIAATTSPSTFTEAADTLCKTSLTKPDCDRQIEWQTVTRRQDQPDQILAGPPGATVLYLLDAATDYEVAMLERWIEASVGPEAATVRIASSRRGWGGDVDALTEQIHGGREPVPDPGSGGMDGATPQGREAGGALDGRVPTRRPQRPSRAAGQVDSQLSARSGAADRRPRGIPLRPLGRLRGLRTGRPSGQLRHQAGLERPRPGRAEAEGEPVQDPAVRPGGDPLPKGVPRRSRRVVACRGDHHRAGTGQGRALSAGDRSHSLPLHHRPDRQRDPQALQPGVRRRSSTRRIRCVGWPTSGRRIRWCSSRLTDRTSIGSDSSSCSGRTTCPQITPPAGST